MDKHIFFYCSIWIQDQNTDSQLSEFFSFEWGQNSSDATRVSDVCVANNGSKVSDTIFLSDASNVNGNVSSNVAINIMLIVISLVTLR